MASIGVLLNPIRSYFVWQKLSIERRVNFRTNEYDTYVWKKDTTREQELRSLVDSEPSNIILITGPKGSDKTTLLKKIIRQRRFSTFIEVDRAETVQDLIDLFVREVGFRPSFAALNTIFTWFSSIIPNAAAPTHEAQMTSLLQTITGVLTNDLRTNQYLKGVTPVFVFDEIDHLIKMLEVRFSLYTSSYISRTTKMSRSARIWRCVN